MHVNAQWIKVGLSGAGAVMAVLVATQLVKPPPLTPVAVLNQSVSALAPVTIKAITWVPMEHPPAGTVTAWAGDPLVSAALTAGTVLTQADFSSAAQAVALKSGEVRYVVAVTPASAVVSVGQRVDLWSTGSTNGSQNGTAPQELAQGVRVIGLFTSSGTPIGVATTASGGLLSGGSSSAAAAPALAALAVPQSAMAALMTADPNQTMLLIDDPAQTQFALVTSGSTVTGTSSHTTAVSTTASSTSARPPQPSRSHTTRQVAKKSSKP